MKIGAEDKKKVIIMAVLLAIAVPLLIYNFSPASGPAPAPAPAPSTATAANHPAQKKPGVSRAPTPREKSLDPSLRTDILTASQKIEYTGGTRNIFRMQEAAPVIPQAVASPRQDPPKIVINNPPQAPPIPLKYYGYSNRPGEAKKAFLQDGDNIFVAVEGEVVERRYRIVKITNSSVLVEDVLNNSQQSINLTPPTTAG